MTYTNPDLAIVPKSERRWGIWNYAALWISMSLCIPTYMLASSLIDGGMNWWQAIMTVFLGNLIVLVPVILNGDAGAKYGIPFPVFARASFGLRGANIPAVLRAIVACGWFGIQTWIGGEALYHLIRVWWPGIATLPNVFPDSFGLTTGTAFCFFFFWSLNMLIVRWGIESIRKLLVVKAIFLPLAAAVAVYWAVRAAKGLGPILARPSAFQDVPSFFVYFAPALTGMIGFWATLSLNIPDFTRYAKSGKAARIGQAIGLPPSMTAFALIGVVVTSATAIVYGSPEWDPIKLAAKFTNPWLTTLTMIAIMVSTLATNIAANIVAPANDFSNLCPEKIDFRRGGYLTGLAGVLMMPWKLVADPTGYIFTWLIGYSGLLGPIGGILIADYYFIRRGILFVDDLYTENGAYWYDNGFNPRAMIALCLGILPNIPGFLHVVHWVPSDVIPGFFVGLYHYSWFVGFTISAVVYGFLSREEII